MTFNLQFSYIDQPSSLKQLCGEIKKASRIAVDTEADSLHHYYEKVCLIQMSFGGKTFLVDPLVKLNLDPLMDLLSHKRLIFHYAYYDLKMLKQDFGFEPAEAFFDTMIASQLLGFEKFSLAALVERFFEIRLPKTRQKSNWSKRPLDEAQMAYAANDTRYLEEIADHLERYLSQQERMPWLCQHCQGVLKSLATPKSAVNQNEKWRIKGLKGLSPRELARIRQVWHWREKQAQQFDVPPFKIMTNSVILSLAQHLPQSHESMPRFKLPSYCERKNGYNQVLEELAKANKLPLQECPQIPEKAPYVPESPTLKQLRHRCQLLARDLNIEASILAPRLALEKIVEGNAITPEEIVQASGLMPWQAELITPVAETILNHR